LSGPELELEKTGTEDLEFCFSIHAKERRLESVCVYLIFEMTKAKRQALSTDEQACYFSYYSLSPLA
jgi:hypothetical protein